MSVNTILYREAIYRPIYIEALIARANCAGITLEIDSTGQLNADYIEAPLFFMQEVWSAWDGIAGAVWMESDVRGTAH